MKKLFFILSIITVISLVSCAKQKLLEPSKQEQSTAKKFNPLQEMQSPFEIDYVFTITNVPEKTMLLNDVRVVAKNSLGNTVIIGTKTLNCYVSNGDVIKGQITVPVGLHDIHFVSGAWLGICDSSQNVYMYNNPSVSGELKAYKNGVIFVDRSPNGIDAVDWNYGHFDVSTNKVVNY